MYAKLKVTTSLVLVSSQNACKTLSSCDICQLENMLKILNASNCSEPEANKIKLLSTSLSSFYETK